MNRQADRHIMAVDTFFLKRMQGVSWTDRETSEGNFERNFKRQTKVVV